MPKKGKKMNINHMQVKPAMQSGNHAKMPKSDLSEPGKPKQAKVCLDGLNVVPNGSGCIDGLGEPR